MKDLRQGDAILPILFNIVLGIAVRKSRIMTIGIQVQDVEETLVALTNQTKRFELEINEKKTKSMRLFRKPYNGGTNIKLGTYEFKVVTEVLHILEHF